VNEFSNQGVVMKKFFILISLLTFLGSCNSRRQMQEERDLDSPETRQAPSDEKSINGKEMGGGGGNR
jgi:hypothetical protein